MAETGLAEILSRTLQQANAHTRGVFGGDNAMSAQEVADFLEENSVAVVSTVTASGTPHSPELGPLSWTASYTSARLRPGPCLETLNVIPASR